MAEETEPTEVKPKLANGTSSEPAQPKQKKAKKKHAPDRPQPTWLFPADDDNPVLNPKTKSEEQNHKETKDRLEAISFLKHKAVAAPMRDAPPPELLSLVGAFLTSFGFNHTCRMFTAEWKAKAEMLDDWTYEPIGKKLPKSMPDLLRIYINWRKIWDAEKGSEATSSSESAESDDDAMPVDGKDNDLLDEGSSDSSDSDDTSVDGKPHLKAGAKKVPKAKINGSKKSRPKDSDSDGSDESSDTDISSEEPKNKPTTAKAIATSSSATAKVKEDARASDSSSTSESDADDESDAKASAKKPQQATAGAQVKNLKRKASAEETSAEREPKAVKSKSSDANAATEPSKKRKKLHDTSKRPVQAEPEPKRAEKANKTSDAVSQPESKLSSKSETKSKSSEPAQNGTTSTSATKSRKKVHSEAADANPSAGLDAAAPNDIIKTIPTTPARAAKPAITPDTSPSSPSSASSGSDGGQPVTTSLPQPNSSSTSRPLKAVAPLAPTENGTTETKVHKKNPNARFQRVPSDTRIDPKYASNAYIPNDYADRAHQDLSVTRGKGFTKEKNKKKKGS